MVNHQHLPTTTPAGVNSYQEVPITIPKEEGRMSATLGEGGLETTGRVYFLEGPHCGCQSSVLAWEGTWASPLVAVGP